MLLDLIEARGDKGKWFAAGKDSGFFDIAVECAAAQGADPSTLVRAASRFPAAKSRNSPPPSRCLLSRAFSLAGVLTRVSALKSTTP